MSRSIKRGSHQHFINSFNLPLEMPPNEAQPNAPFLYGPCLWQQAKNQQGVPQNYWEPKEYFQIVIPTDYFDTTPPQGERIVSKIRIQYNACIFFQRDEGQDTFVTPVFPLFQVYSVLAIVHGNSTPAAILSYINKENIEFICHGKNRDGSTYTNEKGSICRGIPSAPVNNILDIQPVVLNMQQIPNPDATPFQLPNIHRYDKQVVLQTDDYIAQFFVVPSDRIQYLYQDEIQAHHLKIMYSGAIDYNIKY